MDMKVDTSAVDAIVDRARRAQRAYEAGAAQERYDLAAKAAAWALMEPGRNRSLSELAVRATGLGNVEDKIAKNHRKTLGLMRDILGARTCGVTREDPESGITEIARPVGVVGAVVPSTNPVATPCNNIINALKGGNAIVLSPSPKGAPCCEALLGHVHAELGRHGLDPDLVQALPQPAGKAFTQRLLEAVDLAVVTGSRDNVRRAYMSGTPAIGVGVGNAPVIVDETADLAEASRRIRDSKTFDNATSCSSESALVVVDAVYERMVDELRRAGGAMVSGADAETLVSRLWPEGRLNPAAIARDADVMIRELGLWGKVPEDAEFLLVEASGIGPGHPLSGEKLSRVLALHRAADFDDAAAIAGRILDHQGAGHSVGLHSGVDGRAVELALRLPACRVIVNQPHCFATGGSFGNGMPFSLSMGCGSWGGNSIDENLHWRHFIQTVKVVRRIPPREPSLEEIFGDYWAAGER